MELQFIWSKENQRLLQVDQQLQVLESEPVQVLEQPLVQQVLVLVHSWLDQEWEEWVEWDPEWVAWEVSQECMPVAVHQEWVVCK